MGLTTSHLVGVDPVIEERKKVECRFEVSDMGGACVRDQGKRVVISELTSHRHPLGKGIKNIAEGFLELLLCMGEIEVFGEVGGVLLGGMALSLIQL